MQPPVISNRFSCNCIWILFFVTSYPILSCPAGGCWTDKIQAFLQGVVGPIQKYRSVIGKWQISTALRLKAIKCGKDEMDEEPLPQRSQFKKRNHHHNEGSRNQPDASKQDQSMKNCQVPPVTHMRYNDSDISKSQESDSTVSSSITTVDQPGDSPRR
jgi:hypothetical protein